jgi:hypothetical protein
MTCSVKSPFLLLSFTVFSSFFSAFSANVKGEDDTIKKVIADVFSALWFGRAVVSSAVLAELTSPDGKAVLSPGEPFASPAPVDGVTPRKLARAVTAAVSDAPAITPLQKSKSAPDVVGATNAGAGGPTSPRVVAQQASRSVAQIVDLVEKVPSTDWLLGLIRRLLYGGDDGGAPRQPDKVGLF